MVSSATVTFTMIPSSSPKVDQNTGTLPPVAKWDDNDDFQNPLESNDNGLWMGMWLFTVVIFLLLPFTSKRRRVLCMRGIRERRWIDDEEYDNYDSEGEHQQERRQRPAETQLHFRVTRTQEDEIRQQYLSMLMEKYTMTLTNSDIHLAGENDGGSEEMSKTTVSICKDETEHDVENQCHNILISPGIGSQDTINTHDTQISTDTETSTPIREKRADSDDSENLLEFKFDKDQTVSVPLSGQPGPNHEEHTESIDSTSTPCRVVSNGCAICLCRFEAVEEITWSSNSDCCHVFHKDCIVNWYLTVGRKAQRRHIRNNPNMTNGEELDLICKFPLNCPCCRQPFCKEASLPFEKCDDNDTRASSDSEGRTNLGD